MDRCSLQTKVECELLDFKLENMVSVWLGWSCVNDPSPRNFHSVFLSVMAKKRLGGGILTVPQRSRRCKIKYPKTV